ncbi:hypothetical protein QAD02_024373 [Eretmocerus hayati]|uniref:Uncharacterized protein n=1 Tax=Eretmocerus hayati TaxID=131215 RepID=A0ACC2PZL0_9HYME|nr:hypothetical protein QAD02_024373 [Eretmocerus hayati]
MAEQVMGSSASDTSNENQPNEQKLFDSAKSIFSWSKYLMKPFGIWPDSPNPFLFYPLFAYFGYSMVLDYINWGRAMKSFVLMKMIGATMQSVTLLQIFIRILTLKGFNEDYGELVTEFCKDYSPAKYRSKEERKTFFYYNWCAKLFILSVNSFLALVAVLYFSKPLVRQIGVLKHPNRTFSYDLPYRVWLWYKIPDAQTYILTYISQFPILYVSMWTNLSMDCITLALTIHLCGQFAVLSVRIKETDFLNKPDNLFLIIQQHQRLIHFAGKLKKMYKVVLLSLFLGSTISICVLVYQTLVNLAAHEKANLLTYLVFGTLATIRLFAHCWAGEYLMHESMMVSDAYYHTIWYALPVKSQKILMMCIRRSQSPVSLSAGNFSRFSLMLFVNIMKTAMAYLSFLRNFV